MTSKKEVEKRKRGYFTPEDIHVFSHLNRDELYGLLKSKTPAERSVAVYLLSCRYGISEEFAKVLCSLLALEKKLYCRLEICKALSCGDDETARIMIKYLGKIGKNQHRQLPEKEFEKKSYPLPRDLIARTLAHMNTEIIPVLIEVIDSEDIYKIREVVDSIGFICFYDKNKPEEKISDKLIDCYEKNIKDEIIRWKIIRALSAFKNQKSIEFLKNILEKDDYEIIKLEARRSLHILDTYKRHK